MNEQSLIELLKERDEQLRAARDRISELESELSESEVLYIFSESEKMMLRIIEAEIKRIHLGIETVKMTKDEIKLFDTLVKDFVALRGKVQTLKKDEDEDVEDNVESLIRKVEG